MPCQRDRYSFGVAIWPHEGTPNGLLRYGINPFVVAVKFRWTDLKAKFDLTRLRLAVFAGECELADAVGWGNGNEAIGANGSNVQPTAGEFGDFRSANLCQFAGILTVTEDAAGFLEAVELGSQLTIGFLQPHQTLTIGLVGFENVGLFGKEGNAVITKVWCRTHPAA